jgi:hypothetical protein
MNTVENLNVDNIVFSNSFQGTHRTLIPVGITNEENNVEPLILCSPGNLLSFGIQEIKGKDDNLIGYQMPICLWGKKKVTEEERQFTDKLGEILEYVKNFLMDEKEDLNITENQINNLNIINWKYENGEIKKDKGPILYAKLMTNKNNNITTYFLDDNTDVTFDPLELLNKKCITRSAIKIENIIIGNRITIQMKLFEVQVKRLNNQDKVFVTRSLLKPSVVLKRPVVEKKKETKPESKNIFAALETEEDDNEEIVETTES